MKHSRTRTNKTKNIALIFCLFGVTRLSAKSKTHRVPDYGREAVSAFIARARSIFFFSFVRPIYHHPFSLSLPPRIAVSQIRGHIVGSSPSSPLRLVPWEAFLSREDFNPCPLSHGLASNWPPPSAQVHVRLVSGGCGSHRVCRQRGMRLEVGGSFG